MKKFFSFAAFALMLAAATFTLTACGDDDDKDNNNPAADFSIVGTWDVYEDDIESFEGICVFNANNSGTYQDYDNGQPYGDAESFTYQLEGNKLTINSNDEDKSLVMNINIKSATEFTWTDGHDSLTFKKQS